MGNTTVFSYSVDTFTPRVAMPFTMPENGTITSVTMFHDEDSSGDMILAVYDNGGDDKPNNRIAITAETATNPSAGWQTIDLITPVFVNAGATIWLAWVYEDTPGIYYQPGSPGLAAADADWSGGMPDPYGSSTQMDFVFSIYATYTPPPPVEILGDPNWTSGTTHAEEAGSDRALLFTAHAEDDDGAINLASVTYGGEPMTKVIEEVFVSSKNTYVVAYILDEAGISAASGDTFVLGWGLNPPDNENHSSVFLSEVDQTYPLGYTLSATGADYAVSTDPLTTRSGDVVILAGTCGNPGDYDVGTGSGFTEAIELDITSADGIAGYKLATGADETPGIDHSTSYPQALIGFVVQAKGGTTPDTTPPTPTTSGWSVEPVAINAGSITMTANEADDNSGVEYYFDFNEALGGPGGTDSGWQDSRIYTDYDLIPETEYTYSVITRDQSPYHNTGNWSDPCSATTPEAPLPTESCPENDLTGDCKVDWKDLKCLTDQWLVPDCESIPSGCACADLDGHTLVDFNDYAMLAQDWGKGGTGVVINELMAENDGNVPDPCGEYDDWFEIYNPTYAPLDIAGMWVGNDDRDWQIPAGYPETIIPGGGYLVIWADRDMQQGPLHVNFKLDKDGDHIDLYANDGVTLIDTVIFDDDDVKPDYSYGRFPDAFDSWYTMDDPTPWLPNTIGMAEPPYFSHPGGTFDTNFDVGLTTKSLTANIYYTLNGDEPTDSSTPYTGLIPINSTTWVRARAYDSPLDPSYIVSQTYIKLASDVAAFQTNLPIVLVYSHGGDVDYERDYQPVSMVFIDTDETTGITNITDSADFAGLGGMHLRGNSSAAFPKKQYKLETWDENRADDGVNGAIYMDENVSLLGLPSESDWVLQGPWGDKTLMKNYQMFAWSRDIGHYSPRCIFVEAFIDQYNRGEVDWNGGTDDGTSDYRGIYVLMEKNKRDNDRVDIARLEDTGENDCGYLLSKDWGGEEGFNTDTYFDHLEFDDPKGDELTTAQKTWIENYFEDFETALSGGNFDNPAHADYYGNYIDIDSFVNYHILIELCKDVDGFVLSTLLYKDHGGKITMGPLWDLNGSMGAGYFCSYVPQGWLHEFNTSCIDDCAWEYGTFPHDNPQAYEWYQCPYPGEPGHIGHQGVMDDPEFLLKYADNWFHFREIQFDTTKMLNDIDFNANLLTTDVAGSDAVERNFTRWDILEESSHSLAWPGYWSCAGEGGDRSYLGGYVGWIKTWLGLRLPWMDVEISFYYGGPPPVIRINGDPCNTGGHISSSDDISITTPGGTIKYTTDGNDPREHGGSVSASAITYSSSFTLSKSTQLKTRFVYGGSTWGALNEATFAVGPVAENLRITEMMYHPQDTGDPINDPNAEFIELKNIHSSTPINLNLVKFTDGIDFTFPDISLNAGDYIVVAKDLTEFASKYPTFSGTVVGPYIGRLSNAGERVTLEDAFGQAIHNFSFKDGWYHITDGSGFSLDANDPCDPDPNAWEYSEGWRASSAINGTPGADDTGHVAAPGDIVINEVMTHTDVPPEDWIELHNTTSSPIDIGGWFLSDNDSYFKKYEIAAGVEIPGNGYIVFTEDANFNAFGSDPGCHLPFALSEHGETVYLSSGSGSVLTGGYCIKEDFKAAENGVTFGRHTKSAQSGYDVDFVAMVSSTYELENTTGPRVGPIVISEIMYHPITSGQLNNYVEYVELYNISGGSVSLDGWQFTDEDGAIEYYIPPGTSLASGGRLLLVKNLVAFVDEFGPAPPTALEYIEGRLSNAGEKIQISKPGDPEPDFIPYIRVDRVNYSDGSHHENFHELSFVDPWPILADGDGAALHRADPNEYGNDVANWVSGAPTPGS